MGLLDFFNPQDPAKQQGLLSAAAALLQAGGPSRLPISTGQGIGAALGAYQQGTQDYQDRDLRNRALGQSFQINDIKLQDAQSDLANQQLLRDQKKRIAERLAGGAQLPGAAPEAQPAPISSVLFGGGAPAGAQVPAAQPAPAAQRVNQTDAYVERMKIIAQAHADEGDIDGATKIYEQIEKLRPKFDAGITWVNGPGGKPVAVRTADDGTFKQLDGLTPREKLHFLNTGGKTIGVDEYTGAQGVAFANSASPDAVLSASVQKRGQDITARGQDLTNARALEANAINGAKEKAPTEFQGKSAAFGLRAAAADKVLNGLAGNYNPAAINTKNALGNVWVVGGALGGAANAMLREKDQLAEQAQRDFLNATLRQESGAAIADSEFDNGRKQYFPQPGDSDAVIAQKAANRQRVIQGFDANAGRAKIAPVTTATATSAVPAPAQKFDMLPAAAGFAGKRMRADNGTTYRSDGTKWIKE